MLKLDWDFCLHAPFQEENANWTVRGLISRNEYIQLTPDEPVSFGYVTSKNPISASSWRVDFEFEISTRSGEYVGDGIAFWYTRNPIYPGKMQAYIFKASHWAQVMSSKASASL